MRNRYRSMGDVQQRHAGCMIGRYKSDGTIQSLYVRGTDGDTNDPRLVCRDKDSNAVTVRIRDAHTVVNRPTCGYVNTSDSSVFLISQANRQYKRSLSFSNIEMQACGPTSGMRPNEFEMADQLYNENYPSYSEAVVLILNQDNDIKTRAFNKKFAVQISPVNGLVLLYKNKIVGRINENDEAVLFNNYIYLQEQLEEALC